jgi:hypothetical protein
MKLACASLPATARPDLDKEVVVLRGARLAFAVPVSVPANRPWLGVADSRR